MFVGSSASSSSGSAALLCFAGSAHTGVLLLTPMALLRALLSARVSFGVLCGPNDGLKLPFCWDCGMW